MTIKSTVSVRNKIVARKCRLIANKYGERYKKEVMNSAKWTPELLSEDWFSALEFWFSKSFYRGRRDSISDIFMKRTMATLKRVGKNKLFEVSDEEMQRLLKEEHVNNHMDRKMVLQSLGFIRKLDNHNLVGHCFVAIKNKQVQVVFDELQTIYGIGSKLASLFLRDVCFVYHIEPQNKEQLLCLQPVDTWVRQVVLGLGIPGCTQKTNAREVVEPVVNYCLENNISPLLFNAGAWYVGARSFELFLESL